MYNVKQISADGFWVGAADRRIALFENAFPVPRGMSYNAYLILDEKNVLVDTVDAAVTGVFFENIAHLLGDRSLDYVIIQHAEPDHTAALQELILRYPQLTVVGNERTFKILNQFFSCPIKSFVVQEGDSLKTGSHTFLFNFAPMVHWPEVMMSYDSKDRILYSADAFGTFGALNGSIFADEVQFESDWLPEARRYYANIVGKYGRQVQSILQKIVPLNIEQICPLHGPLWRKNSAWFIEKYQKWATYRSEELSVMIAYASIYGNTKNAAEILAHLLDEGGIKNVALYDVSVTHPSYIVAEAFRCSHIVFASPTYNAGIFCTMETVLLDLKAHNLQNRTVAFIENGSWSPQSGSTMRSILNTMQDINILDTVVTLKSSVKEEQLSALKTLSADIIHTIHAATPIINHAAKIEVNALFKLTYGIFVLTVKDQYKDNGCIVNTVIQVTDNPKRISVTVNKANYTHDSILKTKVFNVSILTTDVPFSLIQHFGFQSGKTVDKCADKLFKRSDNGLYYIDDYANAFISGSVIQAHDYGTHTEFIADVTQAVVLSHTPSATYQYYFDHIKPKPQLKSEKKKVYVCKTCGYIYEGDPLPSDFICPLCKHGADDFELLEQ
ncbi:MAG: flavin reductase [Treponema sp.]|jgi:flavorubredoxin/flavin reductase (DIM6/NTAB) family NADH-FMN oxidoreductase RutF|nr:flavin reductase [Treponema sp.]